MPKITKVGAHRQRKSGQRLGEGKNRRNGAVSIYAPDDLPESVMAVLRSLYPNSKYTKKREETPTRTVIITKSMSEIDAQNLPPAGSLWLDEITLPQEKEPDGC